MIDEFPPGFAAVCGCYMYKIYVTSSNVLFVQLGSGLKYKSDNTTTGDAANSMIMSALFGQAGAARVRDGQLDRQREIDRKIEEEADQAPNTNAKGVRFNIKVRKRGFIARPRDLLRVRIDQLYANSWKRFLLGRSKPALFIDHVDLGEMVFVFRGKFDLIVALCELKRLLGDELEIDLPKRFYGKSVTKYRKTQFKADSSKHDDSPLPCDIEDTDD